MFMTRRAAVASPLVLASGRVARAQPTFPTRPVRFIVPYTTGVFPTSLRGFYRSR